MNVTPTMNGRRLMVPKIKQTDVSQAGSAVFEALLQGYNVAFERDQLVEMLQSDERAITWSILEEAAEQHSFQHGKISLLPDDLWRSEELQMPAIGQFRQPDGRPYYVLAWSRVGPYIQVLDPFSGRRWLSLKQFIEALYVQQDVVDAAGWRQQAADFAFQQALAQKLEHIGLGGERIRHLQADALADSSWYLIAALDAIANLVTAFLRTHVLPKGADAKTLVERLYASAQAGKVTVWVPDLSAPTLRAVEIEAIPFHYWSVRPQETDPDNQGESITLKAQACTFLTFAGRSASEPIPEVPDAEPVSDPDDAEPEPAVGDAPATDRPAKKQPSLFELLRSDGLLVPGVVVAALLISATGVIFEAILLNGLMQVGEFLTQMDQRVIALVMLFLFFVLLVLVESLILSASFSQGRRIETRLRMAFLQKIPRLDSHYFFSRPVADLVQRAFSLEEISELPQRGAEFILKTFQLLLTALGIIWIDPGSLFLVVFAIAFYFVILRIFFPVFVEKNIRTRITTNKLQQYSLDALLGLIPIRTHGADRTLRRVYEGEMVEWSEAFEDSTRVFANLQVVVTFSYTIIVAWLFYSYITRQGEIESLLLLAYWALSLPELLRDMFGAVSGYASMHGLTRMLYEPLSAPDEFESVVEAPTEAEEGVGMDDAVEEAVAPALSTVNGSEEPMPEGVSITYARSVAISMRNVTLEMTGKTLLDEVDLEIAAGEHVGIVGQSGAGKSTLVGLLLGWYQPTSGYVYVDDRLLGKDEIIALRRNIAWIDPGIQIWNRSLLDNLLYGTAPNEEIPLANIIDQADLSRVLERLPDGLRSPVGEAGGLISGGEGQRVRVGRAMLRPDAPLVILDEPFRGLDRAQRSELLRRVRHFWRDATLILVSHDVSDVQTFKRALVVDNGRVIEDASPGDLLARPESRYRDLLEAEEAVRSGLWAATDWRHLWLEEGRLAERPGEEPDPMDEQSPAP